MKSTADSIDNSWGHQQISDKVEEITKSIKAYNEECDLAVLEKLKDLCIKENMGKEMARMYRNIGMHHFYSNNLSESEISMLFAVDLLRRENCTRLLIEYYSELGLVYFYNREYIYAKRFYDEVEELLMQETDIDRHIAYLHYLRYGMLMSSMQEYAVSKHKFEKALLFAGSSSDTGLIIMNIGILYKRQKDLKTALRYYSKALCLFDDSAIKDKSIVYNNIAEVYKILGQYKKALSYIEKAFNCINDNDLSRLFVYFNTYTEIRILMGERESVLEDFLVLLARVGDLHLYKGLIIDGISNMIVIGCEDRNILNRLEAVIMELIDSNECNNEEYIKELKVCLGNIRLCLKELEK